MSHPDSYGVYVHLPFCRSRCPYCDFVSSEALTVPAEVYTRAIHREWEARRGAFQGRSLETVYVGGGTPSLWSAPELGALLAPWRGLGASELTVEANPADVGASWFAALVEAGVTRFSLGVQSLDDVRLSLLGRRHDAAAARRAVGEALLSGARVSADLIYATPGSSAEQVAKEAEQLTALGVEHVSAYELTLAPGTDMARRVANGELRSLEEDDVLAQWSGVEEALAKAGLTRYEVSNFAMEGRECRHNQLYWSGGLYAGLGAGAHGHLRASNEWVRYANGPDIAAYLAAQALSQDEPLGLGQREVVSPTDHARELVMLGLRTALGCDLREVRACLEPSAFEVFDSTARRLIDLGHAVVRGDRLAPTKSGMLLADELSSWF